MGRPSIRALAVFQALTDHPGGLTTPQVTALVDPDPNKPLLARYLCYMTLRTFEGQGLVCRAGQGAGRGGPVIWRLKALPDPARPAWLHEKRQATEREIALTSRRIAVLRRKISALAKIEEGIEELEQVEREIANDRSWDRRT